MLTPKLDTIPDELKALPHWCVWKAVPTAKGKTDKIPYSPTTKRKISTKAPQEWVSFEEVAKAANDYDGVGLLCTEDCGYVFGDLDNVVRKGRISNRARKLLSNLKTYCEFSPSTTGVRFVAKGSIPADIGWSASGELELYGGHTARFVTLTGHWCSSKTGHIREPQTQLDALIQENSLNRSDRIAPKIPEIPPASACNYLSEYLAEVDPENWLASEIPSTLDRSKELMAIAHKLFSYAEAPEHVLGFLANSPGAWTVALDHRRQNDDKALTWLWEHIVYKGYQAAQTRTVDVQAAFAELDAEEEETANGEAPTQSEGLSLQPIDLSPALQDEPLPPIPTFFRDDEDDSPVLPIGVLAGVAAGGGLGKSTIAGLQLGVAVSCGLPWLGRYDSIADPMPVLFYTAEETPQEIQRRMWSILRMAHPFESNDFFEVMLKRHFFIYDVGAETDFQITHYSQGGNLLPHTDTMKLIARHIKAVGGKAFVILDPLRRLIAGKEDGEAFTAAVKVLKAIQGRFAPGNVTMLAIHHSSKQSLREGEDTVAAFRGAQDFADAVRWAMVIRDIDPKEMGADFDESQSLLYRAYTVPKNNYGARRGVNYLRYESGAFMHVAGPKPTFSTIPDRALGQLVELLSLHPSGLTKRQIKEGHMGVANPDMIIKLAKNLCDELIATALDNELIEQVESIHRGQRTLIYKLPDEEV